MTEEMELNEPLAHFPEEPEVQHPLNTQLCLTVPTDSAASFTPLHKPWAGSVRAQKTRTPTGPDVMNPTAENVFFGQEFFKGVLEDKQGRNGVTISTLREQQQVNPIYLFMLCNY